MSTRRSGLSNSLVLICALAVASCSRQPDPNLPDRYFPDIPDLPQVGPAFKSPGEGQAMCAPVAVANALAWLEGDTGSKRVVNLADLLATEDYMGTHFNAGTPLRGVIRGVRHYLNENGLAYQRLEYAGWQWVQSANRADVPLSIFWLVQGLKPNGAVWLNLGWYDSPFPGYYHRRGGHWVTLIGYKDGKLLINDPGPAAGPNADPQTLVAREIAPLLTKTEYDWLFPAKPMVELPGLLTQKEQRAYIDGALILELE